MLDSLPRSTSPDTGQHPHPHSLHHDASDHGVAKAEHNIEKILHANPHDFGQVYKELDQLRRADPSHFKTDLRTINHDLHQRGLLPHLQIVEDNRVGRGNRIEDGYAVVGDDKRLAGQPGNHTEVSTSHARPQESDSLRQAYRGMRYHHGRGQYDGWEQSNEGAGGADGGFNEKAIGGHVPHGVRKELIDKALALAGLPQDARHEAAVNQIVTRESGWNPNITNDWDINARRGHPSTGLMQCIPGTFRRFALPGYNSNIHDPLSNLVAGIRYAEAQYHKRGGLLYVAGRSGGY
jgi:hypothetical protein